MKKAVSLVLQFLLFLGAFAAGIILGVFNPLHLKWFVTHPAPDSVRYFDPTGLLLMIMLFLLILLIEAASKRLTRSAPRTSIAFLCALILGLLMHFGYAGN